MRANTIWIENESKPDTYAEFIGEFSVEKVERIQACIACDSHFALYVNGEIASFGEAADYPWYRLYHKVDITDYCQQYNEIKILVWHCGAPSQTYITGEAGLWFEIIQNDMPLLSSGSHILSRKCDNYTNGYCKKLTDQLGYSFYYDNTVVNESPYLPSVVSEREYEFHPRKVGYLSLGERTPITWSKIDDGYLIDMGEEIVGFLDVLFTSPCEQEILIAYGEYLRKGQVERLLGNRDFSVEINAKQGVNQYMNPFRRLAGRYLQVFCKEPLEIEYIGLRPTDRPVVEIKRTFKDDLLQKIYDTSVNTLKKCMHEHYEDCPWREQAMYTLDSRNQMLCGYYAFEGQEFQKENLLFIAKGQRKDGLLSLNFPGEIDIPIPMFSMVYVMQIYDYVEFTEDTDILEEVKPVIDRILDTFSNKIDEFGLIPNFPYPYWNFYEWSDGSNYSWEILRTPDEPYRKQYDLILNCMYVYVCKLYEELFGEQRNLDSILSRIHEVFYDSKRELYKLSTNGKIYSQLGNCMALLIGLGDENIVEKILHDTDVVRITLPMNAFYYDALLQYEEKYHSFIIDDMKKKFGYMLAQGTTTFWEEEVVWDEWEGAVSLCHGWSAIPVYYLTKLQEKMKL